MVELTVYFNPNCSKCRQLRGLLDERGESYRLVEYLVQPPTRAELAGVLQVLGDARSMIRSKDADSVPADADSDAILDALAAHPAWIERPIVVTDDGRGVVARPPERVLELLD